MHRYQFARRYVWHSWNRLKIALLYVGSPVCYKANHSAVVNGMTALSVSSTAVCIKFAFPDNRPPGK
jgi:hypothetical protein